MSGTKPAPMPWISVLGYACPPDSTGLSSASTATTRSEGLRGFSTWLTPVMVPPVLTLATKKSILPLVSFQDFLCRGAAVDFRIGEVLELLRRHYRVLACCAPALRRRRSSPSCPGRPASERFRRQETPASCAARSTSILRHHELQPIAARGGDKRQRDPGISWMRRLDQHAVGMDHARSFPSRRSSAEPMRSFTLAAGSKYSNLARIVACDPRCFGSVCKRTIGVSPIASTMLSKTRTDPGGALHSSLTKRP